MEGPGSLLDLSSRAWREFWAGFSHPSSHDPCSSSSGTLVQDGELLPLPSSPLQRWKGEAVKPACLMGVIDKVKAPKKLQACPREDHSA